MKSASSEIISARNLSTPLATDAGNDRFRGNAKTGLGIMGGKELFMTPKQALKEAQKRWGKAAVVRLDESAPLQPERDAMDPKNNRRHAWRCNLGVEKSIMGLGFTMCMGVGDTWESAFKRSER